MKKIKLEKVSHSEVVALQSICQDYNRSLTIRLKPQLSVLYFETILYVDVLVKLVLFFRTKIENNRDTHNFSVTISQAVILLYSCQQTINLYCVDPRNEYLYHIAEKYKNLLDQKLKSI
ncbi:MAG: hypothetical protein BM557_01180 [Flavobacterium sp. MedPE-SWcel]|nr:MAG: hypothetical protein BM557_01180 [Flavobacterium sp. MedPE-SWcel]